MSAGTRQELWVVTHVEDQDVVATADASWYVKKVAGGDGVQGTDSTTPIEALCSGLQRATEQGLRLVNVFPLGYDIVIVLSHGANDA